jgi:hypothetical protein
VLARHNGSSNDPRPIDPSFRKRDRLCHSQFVLGHSSTHEPHNSDKKRPAVSQPVCARTQFDAGTTPINCPVDARRPWSCSSRAALATRECVAVHATRFGSATSLPSPHPSPPLRARGKKTEKRRLVRARPRVTRRETSCSLISAKAGAGGA